VEGKMDDIKLEDLGIDGELKNQIEKLELICNNNLPLIDWINCNIHSVVDTHLLDGLTDRERFLFA
jgi:hypothetical protein